MLWNCVATEFQDKVPSLIIDETGGSPVPSIDTAKLPANEAVKFGDLLKAGPSAGQFEVITLGDTPIAISLGEANTNPIPVGNPACDDFAVLHRDATVKASGILWPAGATPIQVDAIIAALAAVRIFVRRAV